MIKTRGIGDEPCGSVLNPLKLVNITGYPYSTLYRVGAQDTNLEEHQMARDWYFRRLRLVIRVVIATVDPKSWPGIG